MSKFSDRLKQLRLEKKYSQQAFADLIGFTKSSINMYERGEREPSISKLEIIADFFNVDMDYLLCKSDVRNKANMMRLIDENKSDTFTYDDIPPKKGVKIPVYGKVAAGIPIEMITDVDDFEEIPEDMVRRGTYFALKVRGNSMSPRIEEGDVLIIRQQSTAENGDVVVATVNGFDACVKKYIIHENGISLVSFNPAYDPMYFTKQDIEEKPVQILGIVVENRQKY